VDFQFSNSIAHQSSIIHQLISITKKGNWQAQATMISP